MTDLAKGNDRLNEFLQFQHKGELLKSLKNLNGSDEGTEEWGGLKIFCRFEDALAGANTTQIFGEEITKVKEQLIEVRQAGRTFYCCRTAAVILERSSAAEVDALLVEEKRLQVRLHQALRSKLEDLKAKAPKTS